MPDIDIILACALGILFIGYSGFRIWVGIDLFNQLAGKFSVSENQLSEVTWHPHHALIVRRHILTLPLLSPRIVFRPLFGTGVDFGIADHGLVLKFKQYPTHMPIQIPWTQFQHKKGNQFTIKTTTLSMSLPKEIGAKTLDEIQKRTV